jgi:hypothetical protein
MDRRIVGTGLITVATVGAVAAAWRPWHVESLAPIATQPPKEQFAQGRQPAAGLKPIPFDGDRALKYVKQICELGPRISGTESIKRQREMMVKHFEEHGAKVEAQAFDARQRSRREPCPMVNVIAKWNPDAAKRYILCCHYDTRPIADQEQKKLDWTRPFVSANDGTAGVAMLMELAHHMKAMNPAVGVDFVFFDGEEYVFDTNPVGGDDYFLGSEHFAREYAKTKGTRKFTYEGALLFDLCHHADAELKVEAYSYQFASALVQRVWSIAQQTGAKSFKYERGDEVRDDHLALNAVGIPAVDIIDFRYPHWHKLTDTPDKVSAKQLAEVAGVAATWLRLQK